MEDQIIDPKKELITITNNEIIDQFSIEDLENQISNINGQITRIKEYYEAEIKGLQAEKELYKQKIIDNAFDGYEMPNFDITEVIEG